MWRGRDRSPQNQSPPPPAPPSLPHGSQGGALLCFEYCARCSSRPPGSEQEGFDTRGEGTHQSHTAPSGLHAEPGLNPALTKGALWGSAPRILGLRASPETSIPWPQSVACSCQARRLDTRATTDTESRASGVETCHRAVVEGCLASPASGTVGPKEKVMEVPTVS